MGLNSHGNRDIHMVFRIFKEFLGLAGSQRALRPFNRGGAFLPQHLQNGCIHTRDKGLLVQGNFAISVLSPIYFPYGRS